MADLALYCAIDSAELKTARVGNCLVKNKLARTLPGQRLVSSTQTLDRCASSGHQMPDDRDHGKDQKQMDQTARYVESGEPENPQYEQNDTD